MEFLVLWLITIIISFYMQITNVFKIFKDAADAGYKFDINRMSDVDEQLNPNTSNVTLLSMLIPFFNIMLTFKITIQYNNTRYMLLDKLNILNVLEEMSEIEKKEYLKNPTSLNALLIPFYEKTKLSNATSIKFNDDKENSEIFFEMGKSFNDITILKVEGDATRLTADEQKKKVIDGLNKIFSDGIKEYGDIKNFKKALSNNPNLVLKDNSDDKNEKLAQELSISKQKDNLKSLKDELLEEQLIQTTHTEKGPTLIKRK